jgi:hypothetical protein
MFGFFLPTSRLLALSERTYWMVMLTIMATIGAGFIVEALSKRPVLKRWVLGGLGASAAGVAFYITWASWWSSYCFC